jgi:NAD+ kinase
VRTVCIMINRRRDADCQQAARLAAILAAHGLNVLCMPEDAERLALPHFIPNVHQADVALVLGGDGTLLHAARFFAPLGIPLLGVNIGTLGFMSEIAPDDFEQALERLVCGDYRIEKRAMLRGVLVRGGKETVEPVFALNEIGLFRAFDGGVVRIGVVCDGADVDTYPCDGMMVSTPTGSTGYSLSAGGPIVHPAVDCFVLVPVCAHSLYARPFVVGGSATIDLVPAARVHEYRVIYDEKAVAFPTEEGIALRICRAPFDAEFIRLNHLNYFLQLRMKLSEWNTPARKDERE